MGQLEMKFDNGEKHLEIKMDGIESAVQYKILELCMFGVKDLGKSEPQLVEEPKKEDAKEEELKAGYQLFAEPLLETKEEPLLKTPIEEKIYPRINTYDFNRSVRVFNGKKHYQLFYICPDCGNKGKHHILPGTPKVQCHNHECSHSMMVRLATPKGLPEHDDWGNYYIAGEFKMSLKDKEDEQKFHDEEENRPLICDSEEDEKSERLIAH